MQHPVEIARPEGQREMKMQYLPARAEGEDIYVIDPNLCTECVGFHDYEACQAVCPVECCIPDPNKRETEAVLLARAVKLHPDKEFPAITSLPANLSRFRK